MAKPIAGSPIPTVRVIRRPDGKLDYKPPGEGQAWRKGFSDMSALSPAAMKEVDPPFKVLFLVEDDDAAAGKPSPKKRARA